MATMAFFPVLRLLALAAVFVLVIWASLTFINFVMRHAHVRRQMRAMMGPVAHAPARVALDGSGESKWRRLTKLIEQSGLSLTDSQADSLRQKLVAAGFEAPEAPRLYTLLKLVLTLLFPVAGITLMVASGSTLTVFKLYVVGSALGLFGLFLPAWIVRIRIDRRAEAITNGFPNCLDLMLVCVEAGLGLEAALDRLGRELADTEPLIANLLVRTTLHLRAGANREEALHRLGDMAGVDEIRSFCTLLIQSEKLGSSIAVTLRVFAAEMRDKRRMRAEEKANRLPVLISIPLIVCMLPTMVGVLMVPAMIRVIRQLAPIMSGGGVH